MKNNRHGIEYYRDNIVSRAKKVDTKNVDIKNMRFKNNKRINLLNIDRNESLTVDKFLEKLDKKYKK